MEVEVGVEVVAPPTRKSLDFPLSVMVGVVVVAAVVT